MVFTGILLISLLLLPACSTSKSLFPEKIEQQIDQTVSYAQIKDGPTNHLGKVIELSGEVLSATRLPDRTRITILQLPSLESREPTTDRTQSQGRFMAFKTEFLDPATVPTGSRVTIVGEVSGANTELLDEMQYNYPTVTIKQLKIWPEAMQPPYWYGRRYGPPYWGYPYWYAGGPWGFGRFYGFRPFRYGYWW